MNAYQVRIVGGNRHGEYVDALGVMHNVPCPMSESQGLRIAGLIRFAVKTPEWKGGPCQVVVEAFGVKPQLDVERIDDRGRFVIGTGYGSERR